MNITNIRIKLDRSQALILEKHPIRMSEPINTAF